MIIKQIWILFALCNKGIKEKEGCDSECSVITRQNKRKEEKDIYHCPLIKDEMKWIFCLQGQHNYLGANWWVVGWDPFSVISIHNCAATVYSPNMPSSKESIEILILHTH